VDIEPSFMPRLQTILEYHRQHPVLDDPEQAVAMWGTFDPRAREAAIRHTVRHGLQQTDDGHWTWRDDPVSWATVRPIYQPLPDERWAMLARVACQTLLVRQRTARSTAERRLNGWRGRSPTAGSSKFRRVAIGSTGTSPKRSCRSFVRFWLKTRQPWLSSSSQTEKPALGLR
jgi:hypothetical protein